MKRALIIALLLLAACSSSESTSPTSTTSAPAEAAVEPIVFNGQGNNLDAYASTPDFATQRVYETVETDAEQGRDINAQICFFEGDDGEQWFIAGEDTDQDEPGGSAGWGIFRLEGDRVGELEATQLGKLVPTYQSSEDGAENYGCGLLSDGRIVTTDVGNQAGGDGDGQLIVWFPPFTGGEPVEGGRDFAEVGYCKLDTTLATGQSILVKDDVIYVASSRGDVYRYDGPFPTSEDECGKTITKEVFIDSGPNGLATPAGLAPAPDDGMYVSSVFTGVINEYGPGGAFRRTILQPPEGEVLGEETYATGTPLGIGVGPDGTLYYADIGVVVADGSAGPGDGNGSVRRIRFVDGEPQPPETMASGLDYPDGIGVWSPRNR